MDKFFFVMHPSVSLNLNSPDINNFIQTRIVMKNKTMTWVGIEPEWKPFLKKATLSC